METTKLSINIDVEVHEDFKAIAFFKKTTMTEILMEKIKELIKAEKKNGVLQK